jgi:hypothetical protein
VVLEGLSFVGRENADQAVVVNGHLIKTCFSRRDRYPKHRKRPTDEQIHCSWYLTEFLVMQASGLHLRYAA